MWVWSLLLSKTCHFWWWNFWLSSSGSQAWPNWSMIHALVASNIISVAFLAELLLEVQSWQCSTIWLCSNTSACLFSLVLCWQYVILFTWQILPLDWSMSLDIMYFYLISTACPFYKVYVHFKVYHIGKVLCHKYNHTTFIYRKLIVC